LIELRGEARPLTEWSEVLYGLLRRVLGDWSYDPEIPAEKAELDAVAALREIFEAQAEIPEVLLPVVKGPQALRLTLEALSQETVPSAVDESAVELAGWLELPLDDAPVLVVMSFNEEYVPASVSADLFLPNRLRQQMGVMDNDRRYARDAYALSAMSASRERLVLIAGRRDVRGDPLLPSRLLFACGAAEAAARVQAFYDSRTPSPLPLSGPGPPVQEGPGVAVPRPQRLVEPVTSISVTAFRTYLACPYRFYLQHVLKLESIPHDADELDGGMFGTMMHVALGAFGASAVKDSTSADEIAEFLRSTVQEWSANRYGRYPLPAVSVQIEQAQRRLETFATWQAARRLNGWSIAFVEASAGESGTEFDVGDGRSIRLKGRIDRIDRNMEHNTWALLDYKTGEAANSPEKAHRKHGEWIDLQLPLYRHLACGLGVEGAVALGYVTLPRDTAEVRERMADWTDADLSDADEQAREVARSILDGRCWPPASSPPTYADDFSAICQDNVFDRRLGE
ncbi:MAG: PD-(D/E)XK nuclease family protein, partial [Planctomycetaceae bacterium]